MGMTIKEAILTLNANAVIACERAGFNSATVKMIEGALDTIEDALKAQEPVEPKMMYFVDEGLTWETYEVPTCGACGALLGDALFCPMCGRAVKRND